MTERQIEKTIDSIEGRLLLKTLNRMWSGEVGMFFLFFFLAGMASAGWGVLLHTWKTGINGLWDLLGLIMYLAFALVFTGASSGFLYYALPDIFRSFLQKIKRPKSARIWEFFVEKYARKHGKLSNEAEEIASRILSLYQLDDEHKVEKGYQPDDGPRVLPVRQAARLLHIYEQEQRRVLAVDRSIAEIGYQRDDLALHLDALKEKGERHKDGEDALEKLSEDKEKYSRAKSQRNHY